MLPNSFSPSEVKSSFPTHTEVTIFEAYPENHVLVASLVVPVLPPIFSKGSSKFLLFAFLFYASLLISATMYATLGSMAWILTEFTNLSLGMFSSSNGVSDIHGKLI